MRFTAGTAPKRPADAHLNRCGCGGKLICVDSRPQPDRRRRRYACESCGSRFSTAEIDDDRYKQLIRTEQKYARVSRRLSAAMKSIAKTEVLDA